MRPAIETSRFFVLPDVADADAASEPFQPAFAAVKPKRLGAYCSNVLPATVNSAPAFERVNNARPSDPQALQSATTQPIASQAIALLRFQTILFARPR